MAEVLGTVVGVVSLGLQVCSGLNVYIDGLQCRREEIESTIRHQKSLETLITQIEGLHNRLQAPGVCSAPLEESMASAKAELLLLDEFISKICIEGGTGIDRSAANMMKIQKKRLLYPFRRDRLDRLVTRLDVVIKALQTALQVFELEASFETKSSVEQVLQTVSRSESTILAIERKIDENASLVHLPDYITKQDVMELKQSMVDLMSSSAVGTLRNMVSKPSALKAICDNMTNLDTISRTDGSSLASSETRTTVCKETNIRAQFRCTCNPRRILRRQKRSFGPVSFAKEAVTKRAHAIGCPFALFNIHETNSWSAGITFRAFLGLVSTAVNVSISITTGAGGFGMSPSFTCFQMRENNPAFQVVGTLSRAFGNIPLRSTNEELAKIFDRGIHTLKTIFMSRTSSPFDIDTNGNTLLHAASKPYWLHWTNSQHKLVEFLLKIGVPRDRPNHRDEYAFQNAQAGWFMYGQNDLRVVQTLDSLRPLDGTFTSENLRSNTSKSIYQFNMMKFHQTWIQNSTIAAQVYCGHPLEAILFRSKSRLLQALDKQVSLNLSEADALGFSSLYHLIGWAEGLKIVLSRYGKLILHSHDKGVVASALECALHWSSALCSGPRNGRCSETCPCGEALGLLLQTDGECLARATARKTWVFAIRNASARVQDMVIDELADRRQQLTSLAMRHLKPTEIDRFGLLGNNILDKHTGNVLKALEDTGMRVHPSLRTVLAGEASRTSGSIYHTQCMRHDMACRMQNAFYSRGFTELDVPNSHGLVPLAIIENPFHYREWLVEHGANLATEIPGRPVGFTTAHMLLCPPQTLWSSSPPRRYTSGLYKSLRNHVSKSVSLDACKCGCSTNGCHPYTVMWRAALRDWSVDQLTQASLKKTGDEIIGLCKDFEKDRTLAQDERSICLRVCTSMALPIRHTCCCFWKQANPNPFDTGHDYYRWASRVCEEDEVEEIREEDVNELALLESLLVEFESKIDEMGCTLATFFETYWINRMGQVLQKIQDRTLLEEDIQGAERLGISLRVEEENEQEDTSQLEYWFRQLDALVA